MTIDTGSGALPPVAHHFNSDPGGRPKVFTRHLSLVQPWSLSLPGYTPRFFHHVEEPRDSTSHSQGSIREASSEAFEEQKEMID
ncbi:hypothetical protein [Streptomyces sp. NPDC090029]|uniref:hypothetical protein n=1 Tax=Streptomyces sp. NPDC090029 TaxID=3365924 RepID=UPI0038136A19